MGVFRTTWEEPTGGECPGALVLVPPNRPQHRSLQCPQPVDSGSQWSDVCHTITAQLSLLVLVRIARHPPSVHAPGQPAHPAISPVVPSRYPQLRPGVRRGTSRTALDRPALASPHAPAGALDCGPPPSRCASEWRWQDAPHRLLGRARRAGSTTRAATCERRESGRNQRVW